MTRQIATLAKQVGLCVTVFLLSGVGSARAQSSGTSPAAVSQEALDSLRFRSIGPAVTGGRIHDVEALPEDPATIYVATASGGLWKTVNKGTTWEEIFDDQPVSTFGDVAIAPSDPQVVWAGTGEQQNRQSTSWGNGVYRSTDGGETWTHLGLENTRHIGKVIVHPEDPDVAYVAALGNLWKGSEERGVYKTTDGGETWTKALDLDRFTGVVDMAMDSEEPETLYAAAYQRLRRTWGFNGGGPGSGIYKTTDGGDTWDELTDGLPEGDKGRIGIAIAETDPQVLYATVEHSDDEADGTYRTRDGGQSWERVNELNPRPMYYSHIFVDPTDAERVYIITYEPYVSENGGEQFRELPARVVYDVGVHSDHHALWINPNDPEHFYLGGDGGLHETWDGGETYTRLNNFPIGQFYAIGLDQRAPYHIYGGMQDNHSWAGPNATRRYSGIINDDWKQIGFGDGMYQQPTHMEGGHRYTYSSSNNGGFTRLDAETGDILEVEPRPPEEADEEYRFDWVTPGIASRHDSTTVYLGGNRLFISRDRGQSWTRTDDLTKQIDRETLELMGVQGEDIEISKNDGTASYGEITTIDESPLDADLLWVGTDDGNVQVSRDGGETWSEVSGSMPGVGDTTYVSRVVASAAAPGTAYATFDAHRKGDFAPYVYKTTDFGESWTAHTDGLPEGSVNVIVEHPGNPDVLFLGTEHALFVSTTAGEQWAEFDSNLPTTLYDDLKVHPRENDLVVGTHGRSLWVLDDTTPLAEWSEAAGRDGAHLFSIQPATLFNYWKNTSYRGQAAYAGENPPFGALISYHLPARADSVRLTVRNEAGAVVRELSGPGTAGTIHRTAWNLSHAPPPRFDRYGNDEDEEEGEQDVIESEDALPKLPRPEEAQGPFVSPGTYTVTLQAGDMQDTQTVEVRGDPEMPITQAQYEERETFLLDVLETQHEAFDTVERAIELDEVIAARRDSLEQVEDLPQEMEARADTASARAEALREALGGLYGLSGDFNRSGATQGSLYPPTETQQQHLEALKEDFDEALEAFEAFEEEERSR